jgi:chromosome segregation ATPase
MTDHMRTPPNTTPHDTITTPDQLDALRKAQTARFYAQDARDAGLHQEAEQWLARAAELDPTPARGSADAETLRAERMTDTDLRSYRAEVTRLMDQNDTLRAEVERLQKDVGRLTLENHAYSKGITRAHEREDRRKAERDTARAEAATLRTAIERDLRRMDLNAEGRIALIIHTLETHPAPEAAPPTLTVTREQVWRARLALGSNSMTTTNGVRLLRMLGVTVVDAEADR